MDTEDGAGSQPVQPLPERDLGVVDARAGDRGRPGRPGCGGRPATRAAGVARRRGGRRSRRQPAGRGQHDVPVLALGRPSPPAPGRPRRRRWGPGRGGRGGGGGSRRRGAGRAGSRVAAGGTRVANSCAHRGGRRPGSRSRGPRTRRRARSSAGQVEERADPGRRSRHRLAVIAAAGSHGRTRRHCVRGAGRAARPRSASPERRRRRPRRAVDQQREVVRLAWREEQRDGRVGATLATLPLPGPRRRAARRRRSVGSTDTALTQPAAVRQQVAGAEAGQRLRRGRRRRPDLMRRG